MCVLYIGTVPKFRHSLIGNLSGPVSVYVGLFWSILVNHCLSQSILGAFRISGLYGISQAISGYLEPSCLIFDYFWASPSRSKEVEGEAGGKNIK